MAQPGQTPTAAPPTAGTALARTDQTREVAHPNPAQDLTVQSVAGRGSVERIETTITLPTSYQYAIPIKGKKNPDGSWNNDLSKVGPTADGYDYMNRVVGATFFLPEWVHDQQGEPQRNPIHRRDYIYLRLAAVWYTPLGQLVLATEDVEVDFNLTWMDARINSKSAEVVIDEKNGLPVFDDFGNPAVRISKDDELKALKTLSQLRTFGPRYAQTVARVRLLKLATGIRSLPIDSPRPFPIKVTGYRDQMTPQERIAKVGGDLTAMYGARPEQTKPLTQDEMAEVAPDVDPDTEAIDREAVAAQVREPGPDVREPGELTPEEEAELIEAAERAKAKE